MSLDTALDKEAETETDKVVKTPEELFLDGLNSQFTILGIASELMYLDETYTGRDKQTLVAEGFVNYMDQTRFDEAVDYFSLLTEPEREFILGTRKYNYTLNDLAFRSSYAYLEPNPKKPERKEFKKRGNV
jgi:hypothetical protein